MRDPGVGRGVEEGGSFPGVGVARGKLITPAVWAKAASHGEWECRDFHHRIDVELMEMVSARARGEARFLLVMAPPQHGKTTLVGHALPCVWLGYFPRDRIILASYEAETAEKRGKQARDEFAEFGPGFFGAGVSPTSNANADWSVVDARTGEALRGNMIARGVGGAITGNPCELCLIDDPIKDDKDVRSQQFRDDQWDWIRNVVRKRLRKRSCLGMIYTPWHADDVGQRMIRASVRGEFPPVKVLRLPGVSETQEERDEWARELGLPEGQPDPMGRPPGVALWEDTYSLEEHLRDRKHNPVGFYALTQGRPTPAGGNRFKRDWLKGKFVMPGDVPADCRYVSSWDKAASTKKRSDFTANTLMGADSRGRYYLWRSRAFRLEPYERDLLIVSTADADLARYGPVHVYGQVDPGQAGVTDGEDFRRKLARHWVTAERPKGDKEYRFMPFLSAVQGGNVFVVLEEDGSVPDWFEPWIAQCIQFPKGAHDDMRDTTADAYNVLAGNSTLSEASDENPIDGYDGAVEPLLMPSY